MELLGKIGIPGFDFLVSEKIVYSRASDTTTEINWFDFKYKGDKIPYIKEKTPFKEYFISHYSGKIACDIPTYERYGNTFKNLTPVPFDYKIHFEVNPFLSYIPIFKDKLILVEEHEEYDISYKKGIFLDYFIDSGSKIGELFFTSPINVPEYFENGRVFLINFQDITVTEIDFLLIDELLNYTDSFVLVLKKKKFIYSYFILEGSFLSFFIHKRGVLNEKKLNHFVSDMVSGRDFGEELILDNGIFSKINYNEKYDIFNSYKIFEFDLEKFLRR